MVMYSALWGGKGKADNSQYEFGLLSHLDPQGIVSILCYLKRVSLVRDFSVFGLLIVFLTCSLWSAKDVGFVPVFTLSVSAQMRLFGALSLFQFKIMTSENIT